MSNDFPPFDDELRRALGRMQRPYTAWNLVAMWRRLDDRRATTIGDHQMLGHKTLDDRGVRGVRFGRHSHRFAFGPVSWVAASVIVMLAGWGIIRTVQSPRSNDNYTYATRTGERMSVTLNDGTRVTLAPQTTLTVARDFGRQNRTLSLLGEALFDVVQDARAPFMVRSGQVMTRVLGTRFGVRHYATDAQVRVAVATGKVLVSSVSNRYDPIVVAAGSVSVATDSTQTVAATDDISRFTAWTDGQLVFDRAPVSEILAAMQRWYGYTFRLTDPGMAAQHITTTLNYNDPQQAFARLKVLLDVDMAFTHDSVTLRPRSRARGAVRDRRGVVDEFSPSKEVGR